MLLLPISILAILLSQDLKTRKEEGEEEGEIEILKVTNFGTISALPFQRK